jgi:FtsZ-binding cell division protein ZapB
VNRKEIKILPGDIMSIINRDSNTVDNEAILRAVDAYYDRQITGPAKHGHVPPRTQPGLMGPKLDSRAGVATRENSNDGAEIARAKNAHFEGIISELGDSNRALAQENRDLRASNDAFANAITSLINQNVERDARIAELRTENASLQAKNARFEGVISEFGDSNRALAQENRDLRASNDAFVNATTFLTNQNRERDARIAELTARLAALHA